MKLEPCSRNKNLKRDPQSGMYYWRQYANGKEFFKATGETRSEAKAERVGQIMFAEWLGTPEARKSAQYLFQDIAEKYLDQKKNRRHKTIESAHAHVELHLLPYFKDFPIAQCALHWENYIAHKRIQAPDRKFYNDTKHMRSILRLAVGLGVLSILPTIRCPDAKGRIGKEYTEAELRALLAHANPDLSLQIRLAVMMGMRRAEILQLSWERIDLTRRVIVLFPQDVKTDDGREVPIHPEIYAELVERRAASTSHFLFTSPTHDDRPVQDNKTAWQDCKRKAGVIGRFHDLRHTAVTRMLYLYDIPATKVAAIVGMSIAMMSRYAHPKGVHLHEEIGKIGGFAERSHK